MGFHFPVPAAKKRALRNSFAWRWPENNPHNPRYSRGLHGACDIVAPEGSLCRSPVTGEIVSIGVLPRLGALGNQILIQYGNDRYIRMCHFLNISSALEVGQIVLAGQRLALVGKTGNTSGPHVHFEWSDSPVWSDVKSLRNPFAELERARKS